MGSEKIKNSKGGIVASIFGRRAEGRSAEKKVSSLFKTSPSKSSAAQSAQGKSTAFKKIFPLGVDIGSAALKGIQLAQTAGGSLCVAGISYADIAANLNREQAQNFAANFLKNQFAPRTEVVSVLPNKQTQINAFRLPPMPDNEIETALVWKLRQSGVNIDEVNFDYQRLDFGEGQADNIELLTIVANKKEIEDCNSVFHRAGLQTQAIDAMPLAIVECLLFNKQIPEAGTCIVIEMGANITLLILVINGQVCFVRDLGVTGNFMTQAVVNYFNIGFAEAEAIKKKYGILMDEAGVSDLTIDPSQIKNAFIPVMTDFFADIGYTFKYFSHQITRSVVTKYDKVILSGGAAKLKGMRDFLEDSVKTPVEIANPFREINISEEILRKKEVDLVELAPCFTAAMGLALYNIKK